MYGGQIQDPSNLTHQVKECDYIFVMQLLISYEFSIDLLLETAPISKATYPMAPTNFKELNEQL